MSWRGSTGAAGLVVTLAILAGSTLGLGGMGAAAGAVDAPARVKITAASIGDRSIVAPTRTNPVVINPKRREEISVTVRNDGDRTVPVRYLRITGSLMGVHFVRYQASANVDVAPGGTQTISVLGDFFDVDGVATGYMSATMQVVDDQRNVLATQPFVADVQGKLASSFGLMLLQASLFAIIGIAEIVVGLARRRLPRNRFIRALFFTLTAASVVITIVIGAAMARVALFGASAWVPALVIASLVGFVLGYLSPGRAERDARDHEGEADIDLVAAAAVAWASGEVSRVTTGQYEAHESGGFDAHKSGDHTGVVGSHESGEFKPHDSGRHVPPSHESGGFDPLA